VKDIRPRTYFQNDDGTPTAQEERVAARTGGRRVPGSGASPYAKGDVRLSRWLVECKKTEHASLSIKKSWLVKISKQAVAIQKEPALAIEIQGGPQDAVCDRDWVLIPARIFEKLTEE
jgi:hypothetical protein